MVGKVVNGVLQDANNAITSTKKDTKGTSELGKDALSGRTPAISHRSHSGSASAQAVRMLQAVPQTACHPADLTDPGSVSGTREAVRTR